jgi:hypothetical protein
MNNTPTLVWHGGNDGSGYMVQIRIEPLLTTYLDGVNRTKQANILQSILQGEWIDRLSEGNKQDDHITK